MMIPGMFPALQGYDWQGAMGGLQLPGVTPSTMGVPPVTGPQTTQIGWNAPTAMAAFQGLQTLGNLWQGIQANKLAKRAFNFQKDFANTNLRNQTQEYNTGMADRVASRQAVYAGSANAMSADQANAYLSQNQLRLPSSAQLDPRQRG